MIYYTYFPTRDPEDMVLLPSYQHYIDTIDTIDTMIFGNRLSVPGHHDDQRFVTLAAPVPSPGVCYWQRWWLM